MASLPRIIGMGSTSTAACGPVAVIEWTTHRSLRLLGVILETERVETEVFMVGFIVNMDPLWLGSGVSVAETRRTGRFDLWPETGGRLVEPGSVVRVEVENRSCFGQVVTAYAIVDLDPHGLESMGPPTMREHGVMTGRMSSTGPWPPPRNPTMREHFDTLGREFAATLRTLESSLLADGKAEAAETVRLAVDYIEARMRGLDPEPKP